MPDEQEFISKFWDSIRSDMTAMIAIKGLDPRPMTAHFDGDRKVVYFFTAKDTALAQGAGSSKKAVLVYAAKGHDLALGLFEVILACFLQLRIRRRLRNLWQRLGDRVFRVIDVC